MIQNTAPVSLVCWRNVDEQNPVPFLPCVGRQSVRDIGQARLFEVASEYVWVREDSDGRTRIELLTEVPRLGGI